MKEASYIYTGDEKGFNLLKARDPSEFSIQDNIQNTLLVCKEWPIGLTPVVDITFLRPFPSSVFWLLEMQKIVNEIGLTKVRITGLN